MCLVKPGQRHFAGVPHDFLVSRSFHSCLLRGLLERGRGVLWLSPFELRTLQALTLCFDPLWVSVLVTVYAKEKEEKLFLW